MTAAPPRGSPPPRGRANEPRADLSGRPYPDRPARAGHPVGHPALRPCRLPWAEVVGSGRGSACRTLRRRAPQAAVGTIPRVGVPSPIPADAATSTALAGRRASPTRGRRRTARPRWPPRVAARHERAPACGGAPMIACRRSGGWDARPAAPRARVPAPEPARTAGPTVAPPTGEAIGTSCRTTHGEPAIAGPDRARAAGRARRGRGPARSQRRMALLPSGSGARRQTLPSS